MFIPFKKIKNIFRSSVKVCSFIQVVDHKEAIKVYCLLIHDSFHYFFIGRALQRVKVAHKQQTSFYLLN